MSSVSLVRELREKSGKSDPLKGLRVRQRSKSFIRRMKAHAEAEPKLRPDDSALVEILNNGLEGSAFFKARRVLEAVAAAEGMLPEQLKLPYRIDDLVRLRKEAILIARWLGCSYPVISTVLGYENHTTCVFHAGRKKRSVPA